MCSLHVPQGIVMTIDHGRVLLADADREQALTILRDACVDGRLTLEEFSERADTVLTAHSAPTSRQRSRTWRA